MQTPNDLDGCCFRQPPVPKNPRLLASAEGMYYKTTDGRTILDGTAGLGVNAGHCRLKSS